MNFSIYIEKYINQVHDEYKGYLNSENKEFEFASLISLRSVHFVHNLVHNLKIVN